MKFIQITALLATALAIFLSGCATLPHEPIHGDGVCEGPQENFQNDPKDCGGAVSYTCTQIAGQTCENSECHPKQMDSTGTCPTGQVCCKPGPTLQTIGGKEAHAPLSAGETAPPGGSGIQIPAPEIIPMDFFTEPCSVFVESAPDRETIYRDDTYTLKGNLSMIGDCRGKKVTVSTDLSPADFGTEGEQSKEITLPESSFMLGPLKGGANCGEIQVVSEDGSSQSYLVNAEVGMDKTPEMCKAYGPNADGTCAEQLDGTCFVDTYCERDFDTDIYDGYCEMKDDILANISTDNAYEDLAGESPGPTAYAQEPAYAGPQSNGLQAMFADQPSISASVQAMLKDIAKQEAEIASIKAETAHLEKERARYLSGDKGVKLESVKSAFYDLDPELYKNSPDVLKGGRYNKEALVKLIAENEKRIADARKYIQVTEKYVTDAWKPNTPFVGTEDRKFEVQELRSSLVQFKEDLARLEKAKATLKEAGVVLTQYLKVEMEEPLKKLAARKAAGESALQKLRQLAADNRPGFCKKFGMTEAKDGWLVNGKFVAKKAFKALMVWQMVGSAKTIAKDLSDETLDAKTKFAKSANEILEYTLIYSIAKASGGKIISTANQIEEFSRSAGKMRELRNEMAGDWETDALGRPIGSGKCSPAIQNKIDALALEYLEWHAKRYPAK